MHRNFGLSLIYSMYQTQKVRSLKKGGRIGFIKCGKTLRFDAGDVFSLLTHIDRKADG